MFLASLNRPTPARKHTLNLRASARLAYLAGGRGKALACWAVTVSAKNFQHVLGADARILRDSKRVVIVAHP